MAHNSGTHSLVNAWYGKARWLYWLWPLSLVFRLLVSLRRRAYMLGILKSWKAPVPVIVVGNINVGGAGKTPLVIALVKALQMKGLNPAIVSRGYGSCAPAYPFHVTANVSAEQAGDEPLLLAARTKVPVVIGADRVQAVQSLLAHHACDVIISDDGLQHYALSRDIELAVVDGKRLFGNQLCLPAGPLREPVARLNHCDYVISNGRPAAPIDCTAARVTMQLQPVAFERVVFTTTAHDNVLAPVDLSRWGYSKRVHAIAGIGHPGRFFSMLRGMGFSIIEHVFDDHHRYSADDLRFADNLPVLMTEKDAVKVRELVLNTQEQTFWYVPVNAVIEGDLLTSVAERVKALLVNECPSRNRHFSTTGTVNLLIPGE